MPSSLAAKRPIDPLFLFAPTIFLSAWLLFQVQPMFGKMALPLLGGAPSVWNTALVFFQAALLLGYLYAHWLGKHAPLRWQIAIHIALLAVAFVALPVAIGDYWRNPPEGMPILWLLALLTVSVGLPFFAVSANSPLLQGWFARTGHATAKDPYFLYAASNLGSMLALLSYPFLLEPSLALGGQSALWTAGFALLAVAIGVCGWRTMTSAPAEAVRAESEAPAEPVSWRLKAHWVALAFVPSGLLVAVTSFMTTDLVAIPLLWIVPLALYLLSFVFVFARKPILRQGLIRPIHAVALCFAAFFATINLTGFTYSLIGLALVALFTTAMICHGALADRRPAAAHLTEFYVWMSLGGILGSAFAALVAPAIFTSVFEYPLLLVLAAFLRPQTDRTEAARPAPVRFGTASVMLRDVTFPVVGMGAAILLSPAIAEDKPDAVAAICFGLVLIFLLVFAMLSSGRPLRFGLSILAIAAFGFQFSAAATSQANLHKERTFFGTYSVQTRDGGKTHLFGHGSTIHGAQFTDPARRLERNTYYHADAGIGRFLGALAAAGRSPERVGAVGLGVGELACYRRAPQDWTFFEIDAAVVRIAKNRRLFTFLTDCAPEARIVLGDGRLTLAKEPNGGFDLLVLDAFSSDSIPVHLLTREALRLYVSKTAKDGFILMHVSNRYLNLKPVVAALAKDAGLAARVLVSRPPQDGSASSAKYPSDWIALARDEAALAALTDAYDAAKPTVWGRWAGLEPRPGARVWTDDYSNVVGALE